MCTIDRGRIIDVFNMNRGLCVLLIETALLFNMNRNRKMHFQTTETLTFRSMGQITATHSVGMPALSGRRHPGEDASATRRNRRGVLGKIGEIVER